MFNPISVFLGLRYAIKKPSQFFVSFVSISSLVGIALGVAILITVMSVMNGFNSEMTTRFIDSNQQVVLTKSERITANHPKIDAILKKDKRVLYYRNFIEMQGLIISGQSMIPTLLKGIDTQKTPVKDLPIHRRFISLLKHSQFGVVLPHDVAERQAIEIGDLVTILVPVMNYSIFHSTPQMKKFKVVGILPISHSINQPLFLSMENIRKMGKIDKGHYSGIELAISHPESAHFYSMTLEGRLPKGWFVSDWSEKYQSFFRVLAMQKSMMFLVLFLIIFIAAFGLVSGQVMLVVEKKREIAILKTMGLSNQSILLVFITQGLVIGLIGLFIGTCLGYWLSLHVTDLVTHIELITGHEWLSHALYNMDHLPSRLEWVDVYYTVIFAGLLCFFATLYPAYMASSLKPIGIFKSGQGE